ncbi:MAG: hypothetical protein EBZ48_03470 [Proteobacteria bacterium]|nr:hypothetical protein [Pseudomonadota bacterium]
MIRRLISAIVATCCGFIAFSAQAQSIRPLADLNTSPAGLKVTATCSGAGINLAWINSAVYGNEPFITDGTAAGTQLLKDLVPGLKSSRSADSAFPDPESWSCLEVAGKLYFMADNKLWRTNGTTNGTASIYAPVVDEQLSSPAPVIFGGRIFFVQRNKTTQKFKVYSILPNGTDLRLAVTASSSTPDQNRLMALNDGVYYGDYPQSTSDPKVTIYRTTGDAASTMVAKEFSIDPDGDVRATAVAGKIVLSYFDEYSQARMIAGSGTTWNPLNLLELSPFWIELQGVVNGRLLLRVRSATGDAVLSTDGTDAGTVLLMQGFIDLNAVLTGNTVAYLIRQEDSQCTLLRTDGIALTPVTRVATSSTCRISGMVGDTALTLDIVDNSGYQLLAVSKQDNTERVVKSLPNAGEIGIGAALPSGDGIFFVEAGGKRPATVFTDGTAAGTRLLFSTEGATADSLPHGAKFTEIGDRAIFFASGSDGEVRGFVTDGAPGGSLVAVDASTDRREFSKVPFTIGGQRAAVYRFWDEIADDGYKGLGLVNLETGHATTLVPREGHSIALNKVFSLGSKPFFFEGTQLWRSEGTAASTSLVANITPPAGSTIDSYYSLSLIPADGAPSNGMALFMACKLSCHLWRTDGTAAGTVNVTTRVFGYPPMRAGSILYLPAQIDDRFELWRSDGTAAGTTLVSDLGGISVGDYNYIGAVGSKALFNVQQLGSNGDYQLWITDGTAAGTFALSAGPKFPIVLSSNPAVLYDNSVLLGLDESGRNLIELVNFQPNYDSNSDNTIETVIKDGVAYIGGASALVRSNGTVAGTMIVHPNYKFGGLAALSSAVIFVAASEGEGIALYRTDGTVSGTYSIVDALPNKFWRPLVNTASASPPVVVNDRALMAARHPMLGGEPIVVLPEGAVPPTPTPTPTPTATATPTRTATPTPTATNIPQLPQPAAPVVKVKKGNMTVTMASTPGVKYVVRLSWLPPKAKKGTKPKVTTVTVSAPTLIRKKVKKGSWSVSYHLLSINPGALDSLESPVAKAKA